MTLSDFLNPRSELRHKTRECRGFTLRAASSLVRRQRALGKTSHTLPCLIKLPLLPVRGQQLIRLGELADRLHQRGYGVDPERAGTQKRSDRVLEVRARIGRGRATRVLRL